ncbi:MAG: hypothetical protein IKF14_10990 [Atopobiaceae bacterium]|nr:hypothetical protein [Atopobiaceae bacterium]
MGAHGRLNLVDNEFLILKSIPTTLWEFIFGSKPSANIQQGHQAQMGFELALTEDSMTIKSAKYMKQRERIYQGDRTHRSARSPGRPSAARRKLPNQHPICATYSRFCTVLSARKIRGRIGGTIYLRKRGARIDTVGEPASKTVQKLENLPLLPPRFGSLPAPPSGTVPTAWPHDAFDHGIASEDVQFASSQEGDYVQTAGAIVHTYPLTMTQIVHPQRA